MDKYETRIENCYRRMKRTLERGAGVLKTESETELLHLIYEDLAIDVQSDLCNGNLESMLEYNYIYPELMRRIVLLREDLTQLINTQRTAAEIRDMEEWKTAVKDATEIIGMLYI